MRNIYCSFIGNADIAKLGISGQVNAQSGQGPLCCILSELAKNQHFDCILILKDQSDISEKVVYDTLKAKYDFNLIISDIRKVSKTYNPANHKEIHTVLDSILPRYNQSNTRWYFNLSSGTPAMSAMLLLYGKTHFDSLFFQTYYDRSSGKEIYEQAEIPFGINLRSLNNLLSDRIAGESIIGTSPRLLHAIKQAEKVALFGINCLIFGESGTGKELIARRIGRESVREKYAAFNCSLLSKELARSELFGHKKGSFTGAETDKTGLFEDNNGGIIFLDEIGDLHIDIQTQLLRTLQEKKISRLGDTKEMEIDVQVIAATNKDIPEMIRQKRFREDLYYRLAIEEIWLEPLRERREDIPLIIDNLLDSVNREFGRLKEVNYRNHKIAEDARQYLSSLEYPGNVRQLEHIIKRACMWSENETISLGEIIELTNNSFSRDKVKDLPSLPIDLNSWIAKIEFELLNKALEESGGRQNSAAEKLGLRADTFNKKFKKYKQNQTIEEEL
jgi:DNA-binding NtrC family response regulator